MLNETFTYRIQGLWIDFKSNMKYTNLHERWVEFFGIKKIKSKQKR